jgi:hypothetical protein
MSLDLTLPLPRRRRRRRTARRIFLGLPGRGGGRSGRRRLGVAGVATGAALVALVVRRLTGRRREQASPYAASDPDTAAVVESTSTGDTPEGARSK